MLKKIMIGAGVVLGAFVALCCAAALFIRLYFPQDKIRAMVVTEAENSLHRKIEIKTAEFGLFKGLAITGVRISERPDFTAGEFLKADAFVFRFSLLPLLQKKLVANELRLDGLQATVKKDRKGNLNISDLMTPATGPTPPRKDAAPRPRGEEGAAAMALTVDSLVLKDAGFVYLDEGEKSRTEVKVPVASLKDFSIDGAFPFEVQVALDQKAGAQRLKATFKAKGTIDLAKGDAKGLKLDVKELALETEGLKVSGDLTLADGTAPKIDGHLKTSSFKSEALAPLLGAQAPGGYRIPEAELNWSVVSEKTRLSVKAFTAKFGGIQVDGKAEIPDTRAREMRISLEAASNDFDLAPLAAIAPMTRDRGIDGRASFKLTARGPVADPDVPNAEFHLDLKAIKAEDLRALTADEKGVSPLPAGVAVPPSRVDVVISKAGNALEIKKASISAGEIRGQASGSVFGLTTKAPTLKLAIKTETVPFTAFAPFITGITNLHGQARLSAAVGGTTAKPKVDGTLTLEDAGFEYLKQKLEKFAGAVRFSENAVELPKLTGRVNGGDLDLKFSAVDFDAPNVTVQGTLTVLDAGALEALMSQTPGDAPAKDGQAAPNPPPYTGPVMKTSGSFKIGKITHPNFTSDRASMEWALTGVTPEFKLMDGTAKLRVASGHAVKLLTLAKSKGGMAKAMAQPLIVLDKARGKIPGVAIPPMEDIPFDRIEGDYTFRKGVMDMQPSLIDGPTLRAETRGTVDLPASTQDLRTEMKVENIGNVAILITGSMDDPTIRPDLAKAKEKVKEEAKDYIEKHGKDLLKKFLKR